MKKFLSCLLAFLLIITPMVQSVHAEEISEEELYGEVRDTLEMIFDIEDELEKLGLTFEDLLSIQEKDEKFYEELRQYLQEQEEGTDSSVVLYSQKHNDLDEEMTPFESDHMKQFNREEADRWVYAERMASENNTRDKNHKEYDKEVVYMFMSHFIDVTTRKIGTVKPEMSHDGYYSAWITNRDREVYDTYLRGVGLNHFLFNAAQLPLKIKNKIKDAQANWRNFKNDQRKLFNALKIGSKLYSVEKDRKKAKKDFKVMSDLLKDSTTSRAFLENLNRNFAKNEDPEEIRKKKVDFFVELVLSSGASGPIGFFKGLGSALLTKFTDDYEQFFYNLWWLAMVQSNGLRRGFRAERYLRYHGLLP